MVNQIVCYCLAYAASIFGVSVHAVAVMSNHLHLVFTDNLGQMPAFMERFDRLVALCVKVYRGIDENLWAPGSYDAVELTTSEAGLEKLLYALANPVEAELVDQAKKWPGVISSPWSHVEVPQTVERPKVYFDPKGKMPEEVSLQFEKLPHFADMSDEAYGEIVASALRQKEKGVAARVSAQGRRFMGRKRVLRQRHITRPKTLRPPKKINPRVAGRNTPSRVAALERLRAFHEAYREAYQKLKEGCRDIVFPPGTYRLRCHFGVRCQLFPA